MCIPRPKAWTRNKYPTKRVPTARSAQRPRVGVRGRSGHPSAGETPARGSSIALAAVRRWVCVSVRASVRRWVCVSVRVFVRASTARPAGARWPSRFRPPRAGNPSDLRGGEAGRREGTRRAAGVWKGRDPHPLQVRTCVCVDACVLPCVRFAGERGSRGRRPVPEAQCLPRSSGRATPCGVATRESEGAHIRSFQTRYSHPLPSRVPDRGGFVAAPARRRERRTAPLPGWVRGVRATALPPPALRRFCRPRARDPARPRSARGTIVGMTAHDVPRRAMGTRHAGAARAAGPSGPTPFAFSRWRTRPRRGAGQRQILG